MRKILGGVCLAVALVALPAAGTHPVPDPNGDAEVYPYLDPNGSEVYPYLDPNG